MILDELVLNNYGVYKGEHRFVLTPEPGKPIVLIGALNGGGKTTVLEALQVALFGRNANPIAASRSNYIEHLRRSIHMGSTPSQAGLEVSFRYNVEGHERKFKILRTWREAGASIKEGLEVYRDDVFDGDATDRWNEFIEQVIPHQISDLFFFDGEKIESLADPIRSAEILRVGVHALLGLDLIDDLIKSLGLVERRRKAEVGSGDFTAKKLSIESSLTDATDRRRVLCERRAATQTILDEARQRLRKAQQKFQRDGGELFERREELRMKLEQSRVRKKEIEERMRDIAGGISPLILVRNLLEKARETLVVEDDLLQKRNFAVALEDRDQEILKTLEVSGLNVESIAVISDVLASDRSDRQSLVANKAPMGLRPEALGSVTNEMLDAAEASARDILQVAEREGEALTRLEAKEAAIPEGIKVKDLTDALNAARFDEQRLLGQIEAFEIEHTRADGECRKFEEELQRLHDEIAEASADDELRRRVLVNSARSRESLQKFRHAMRSKHITRLEGLVTQCFQTLLRKRSLVERIVIDPESFVLDVRGNNGAAIPPERLSAGERQMLAVSMLWGLARASERNLPAIIDTPLGRLDSEHRKFLIQNYFPVASHQVILLSTDEEINGAYYLKLKPHITREYLVEYDDTTSSSKVFEGYFRQARLAA